MGDTQTALTGRDHGGGLDAAVARFGGSQDEWIDLSTGINPRPYPFSNPTENDWTRLPDLGATQRAESAARSAWNVPEAADLVLVPGLSFAIAQLPYILTGSSVSISEPTYNEYRNAFSAAGWSIAKDADVDIHVSPNNPTGAEVDPDHILSERVSISDESFADQEPESPLMALADRPNVLVMRGLGKFWGLAGVRFGAVMGDRHLINALRMRLGPWGVSGPALTIATEALSDQAWIDRTRRDLRQSCKRLEEVITPLSQSASKGTYLFRSFQIEHAHALHEFLAQRFILTRVFPYSDQLIRFGLPKDDTEFDRLRHAIDAYDK